MIRQVACHVSSSCVGFFFRFSRRRLRYFVLSLLILSKSNLYVNEQDFESPWLWDVKRILIAFVDKFKSRQIHVA